MLNSVTKRFFFSKESVKNKVSQSYFKVRILEKLSMFQLEAILCKVRGRESITAHLENYGRLFSDNFFMGAGEWTSSSPFIHLLTCFLVHTLSCTSMQ